MLYSYPDSIDEAAAVLDDYDPDWRKRIDLKILDINNCEKCILGQLFGDYDDGIEELFGSVPRSCYSDGIFGYQTDVNEWIERIKPQL